MSSEPPKVKDSLESLKDLMSKNSPERLIEVSERSDVLELGILQESNGLLPELVNLVIIIEPSRIRKFTELEKPTILLMLPPNMI